MGTILRFIAARPKKMIDTPLHRPASPNFSSGPCKKRPGYSLANLDLSTLGRSHRASPGKSALKSAIDRSHRLLGLPADYRLGIVPASDTGALEMALWSLLGPRPVDVLAWESFGKGWLTDIKTQLKLERVHPLTADYGRLPDLTRVNPAHDLVFTWNGTTSGVRVPDGNWIDDQREGLVICDATSAVFAMPLPWEKLDVTTYSWQKVLGGEGAHGVIILSPRAVARLETHTPSWPMPKIFRLCKNGKLNQSIFEGSTINTPSMLCVADYLDALDWVEQVGGVAGTIARSQANFEVVREFVGAHPWISFLAEDPATLSNTSVCLTLDISSTQVKTMVKLLDDKGVAYDIGAYRDAPAGLRIWCGATIETEDLKCLMPWIQWAYETVNQ